MNKQHTENIFPVCIDWKSKYSKANSKWIPSPRTQERVFSYFGCLLNCYPQLLERGMNEKMDGRMSRLMQR